MFVMVLLAVASISVASQQDMNPMVGTLTAWMDGNSIVLTDEKGGQSRVTIANVYQSNGVIHVVDTVLLPK